MITRKHRRHLACQEVMLTLQAQGILRKVKTQAPEFSFLTFYPRKKKRQKHGGGDIRKRGRGKKKKTARAEERMRQHGFKLQGICE